MRASDASCFANLSYNITLIDLLIYFNIARYFLAS